MKALWVLEDHASLRSTLKRAFSSDAEIHCAQAFGNAEALLFALETEPQPDILLVDLGLPDANGLDVISQVRERSPSTVVIILTVYEDDEKIFRAICAGAAGYLLKGSSINAIIDTVRDALHGGSPMTASIARRVLQMFSKMAPPPTDYALAPREKEILQLIVAGKTNKELAYEVGLSIHTVDTYLRRIYSKLEVNNRSGAVAKAMRNKLV